jgi:uncharacterized protein (TIGR03790 family)
MLSAMRFLRMSGLAFISAAILASACSDSDTTTPTGDAAPANDAVTNTDANDAGTPGPPEVLLPRTGILPSELGVLVNDDDPLSVSIAAYYVQKRNIPPGNVVHLKVPMNGAAMTDVEFAPLKTAVDAAFANTTVQAMAITWTTPYRVGNMSVTSAFALGYKAISGDTCNDVNAKSGTPNPYVTKRASTQPFTDLKFRPAMTIPATTLDEAKKLIDRGVASDDTWPTGTGYYMETSDKIRSARCIVDAQYGYINECQKFLDTWDTTGSGIGGSIVKADFIENKTDVLFYVQGLASVTKIATNTYLPGAIADHLTSYGGQIPTSGQMSAFQFIVGGATGSFGTVVEPCAYQEKFPDPRYEIPQYFGGATLVEAYWKSVVWPAEGIFIGEPLARPFGTGFHTKFENGTLTIETTTMVPAKKYLIEAADSSSGPFTTVLGDLSVPKYTKSTFKVPNADRRTYRFREQ